MELIDVTIPRRNTVEGVEVWDDIASGHFVVKSESVGIQGHLQQLPFPDVFYHLREQLEMLCEVADNSSRHQDKMCKRFTRLDEIYEKQEDKRRVTRLMSAQIGVPDIMKLDPSGKITIEERIYKRIKEQGKKVAFRLDDSSSVFSANPASKAYRLGLRMMNAVRAAADVQQKKFDIYGNLTPKTVEELKKGREWLFKLLPQVSGLIEVAWSDDLILLGILRENGYLQLNKIGMSGIPCAAVCRVLDSKLESVSKAIRDKIKGVQGQSYQTARANGYSRGIALVLFEDGKAIAMLTLTTASREDVAFLASGPAL